MFFFSPFIFLNFLNDILIKNNMILAINILNQKNKKWGLKYCYSQNNSLNVFVYSIIFFTQKKF